MATNLAEKIGVKHDPPLVTEYQDLSEFCQHMIRKKTSPYLKIPKKYFIGTGGTATTIAAMQQEMTHYNPEKINNFPVSYLSLQKLKKTLLSMSINERVCIKGLERGREDIILAGVSVFLNFMELIEASHIIVSDAGLLEGIINNTADNTAVEPISS